MKAHLISQVLLKRFSNKGKVKVNNIKLSSSALQPTKKLAYINVEKNIFEPIEKKYAYIETRMASAFEALDKGTLLTNEKYIESVKKFMALHYVRGSIFYFLMQEEPKYFEQFLENVKRSNPDLKGQIDLNNNVLRDQFRTYMIQHMPKIIKPIIRKVETFLSKYNLEIATSPDECNFLLGDIATLTISADGTIGVLSGAAITNSVGFLMPLGPKHIVAVTSLKKPKQYGQFTIKQTGLTNEKMLKQCVAEYYSLP